MSIKQEQHEPRASLDEDAEIQLIEAACERLVQSVQVQDDQPPRTSATAVLAAMRATAGYVAISLSLLIVGSVAAQRGGNEEREEREERREERLEERADEREDAREAREGEREDFQENAEARAERRATARTSRWDGLREQAGLRNPSDLSAAALDELRTHARREARLRVIRARAVTALDSATVTRADAVLEREARRHDVALSALMAAHRRNDRANDNKMIPSEGGAQ